VLDGIEELERVVTAAAVVASKRAKDNMIEIK